MKLGEFREMTKDIPDDVDICYHSYFKGCSLSAYKLKDFWLFEKDGNRAVVMNPDVDYDARKGEPK
jgi:hypothetical protein